MKTVLYLIQAAAGLPKIYSCLRKREFLLLSYKENTADTTILAPSTTWAEGRNLLYNYVRDNNLKFDYYTFMDEDVVFQKVTRISKIYMRLRRSLIFQHLPIISNQEAGFKCFENTLELGYPIVTMYNCCNEGYINNCTVQTVAGFDAMMAGISKEVFFANTVLPYEVKFDNESWWITTKIFVMKANYYYRMKIIQNNQLHMYNTQHSDYQNSITNDNFVKQTKKELSVLSIDFSAKQPLNVELPTDCIKIIWHRQILEIFRMVMRIDFFQKCILYLWKKYKQLHSSNNFT